MTTSQTAERRDDHCPRAGTGGSWPHAGIQTLSWSFPVSASGPLWSDHAGEGDLRRMPGPPAMPGCRRSRWTPDRTTACGEAWAILARPNRPTPPNCCQLWL